MIIDEKIKIFITNEKEKKKYNKKGYECNIKEYLEINILDLNINSHIIILVKCDYCGKEVKNPYYRYNRNTKNNTENFCCSDVNCMKQKRIYRINQKYGVDNVFKSETIKEKIKKTCLEKYGVENPQQNKNIKEKSHRTNIIKYGFRNVFQNDNIKEKSKKTCLQKYGVEYIQQNKECHKKSQQTSLKNFGVEYPNQNKEQFEKIQKSQLKIKYYNDTIFYQGSYEKHFLDTYYNKVKIENGFSIKYFINNEKHYYHPDFYLPEYNLVVEIKSIYWFNIHKEKCLIKEQYTKKSHNYILILEKNYVNLEKILQKKKNNI